MAAKNDEKAYILVIDDDPLLTKTLKKLLTRAGFVVDVATDGAQGIEKAKSGFFHLVLCDIRMPGLDGLMTIERIQQFQKKANVGQSGFIVITAYDSDESRNTAFQLGVTDFLKKPFDTAEFLSVIQHHAEQFLSKTPEAEVKKLNERLSRLLGVPLPKRRVKDGKASGEAKSPATSEVSE